MDTLNQLIQQFMPFAQERMGFKHPPRLFLRSDAQNASDMLGRTAQYNPTENTVVIYVTDRHPKDILRSLSHELVHHTQNGRGDFENGCGTEPGYAQNDVHMREMEREAYESGNLCFRDWEDSIKDTIYNEHLQKGDKKMSIKEWKNGEISALLSEAWGFKFGLDDLNEGTPRVGYGADDEAVEPEDKTMKKGLEDVDEEVELDEVAGVSTAAGERRAGRQSKKCYDARDNRVECGSAEAVKEGKIDEDKPYTAKKEDEDEDLRKGAEKRGGEGTLAKTPGHGRVDYVNEDKPYTAKKEEPEEDLRKGAEKRGAEGTLAKTKGHGKVDYVKEDSGEEEGWHEWKNEHADDDHIQEIEHHLRALKDDRDYERHGAEYDHDKYEDEGMEEDIEERRGRGRKGPHTRTDDPRLREVMKTVAKKYPNISEERMQKLAAYAMRTRKQ